MKGALLESIIVLLAIAAATLVATAQPSVKPGAAVAIKNRASHTCADPNNPGIVFQQKDGGYLEAPQGWFIRAEVHQSTSWALAYCYYGLDKANPPARPVYSVHYEMTGFKSNQCSALGKTVTCQGPGLKQ